MNLSEGNRPQIPEKRKNRAETQRRGGGGSYRILKMAFPNFSTAGV
jgi:hypothetical protein